MKVLIGYKILLVLEKEVVSANASNLNKKQQEVITKPSRPPTSHSHTSSISSPVKETLTRSLQVAHTEIDSLKKELDFCKSQMKQKD
jgi:bacterioferritin (cytochrome b1)